MAGSIGSNRAYKKAAVVRVLSGWLGFAALATWMLAPGIMSLLLTGRHKSNQNLLAARKAGLPPRQPAD